MHGLYVTLKQLTMSFDILRDLYILIYLFLPDPGGQNNSYLHPRPYWSHEITDIRFYFTD